MLSKLPKLNNDICSIISLHLYKPEYKLLDWIETDKLNWNNLSLNPNAIGYLKKVIPNKINWKLLCLNNSNDAIELLRENPHKIDWDVY